MNLEKLELRGFRNYEEVSVEFDPGVNLIVGDNAQGKTNLLEAISYLGSGRSFRAQKNAEMVRFGSDFAEIDGKGEYALHYAQNEKGYSVYNIMERFV